MFTTQFNPKEFCSSFLFLDHNEIFATDTLANCFYRINSNVLQYFIFDQAWRAVTQQWIQVCSKAVYWIPNHYTPTGTKFGHAAYQYDNDTMLYLTNKKVTVKTSFFGIGEILSFLDSYFGSLLSLAAEAAELENQHNLVPNISLEFVKTPMDIKCVDLPFWVEQLLDHITSCRLQTLNYTKHLNCSNLVLKTQFPKNLSPTAPTMIILSITYQVLTQDQIVIHHAISTDRIPTIITAQQFSFCVYQPEKVITIIMKQKTVSTAWVSDLIIYSNL